MIDLPLSFHYIKVYMFFTIHFTKSKLMEASIPVINILKKYVVLVSRYVYYYILFTQN